MSKKDIKKIMNYYNENTLSQFDDLIDFIKNINDKDDYTLNFIINLIKKYKANNIMLYETYKEYIDNN